MYFHLQKCTGSLWFLNSNILVLSIVLSTGCKNNEKKKEELTGKPKSEQLPDKIQGDNDRFRNIENDTQNNNKIEKNVEKQTFLSTDDFSNVDEKINRSAFETAIQGLKFGFQNIGNQSTSIQDVDDCTKKMQKNNLKISDQTIENNVEIKNCSTTFKGQKVLFDFTGKMMKKCSKDGFSKLIGKTDNNILGKDLLENCKSAKVSEYLNVKMDYENQDINGRTLGKSSLKFAKMQRDGDFCLVETKSDAASIENTCGFYSKETYSNSNGDSDVRNLVFKGNFEGVKISYGRQFYTGGSMTFTLNNWSGTIFFSNSNPRYEARSQNGETIKGNIR